MTPNGGFFYKKPCKELRIVRNYCNTNYNYQSYARILVAGLSVRALGLTKKDVPWNSLLCIFFVRALYNGEKKLQKDASVSLEPETSPTLEEDDNHCTKCARVTAYEDHTKMYYI
jgi:hypothetical protein